MISLYRKGTSHQVRSIVCEARRFHVGQLQKQLLEGWYAKPEDIDAVAKSPTANQLVRLEAKKRGIESYKTARLSKLRELLSVEG